MKKLKSKLALALASTFFLGTASYATDEAVIVNVDNFARAETDMQIGRMMKLAKKVNIWSHLRLPTPLDKQNVIRMNRDTLYSFAIVDISKGATMTMPDVGKRYMTVMVVNHDGYINKVFYGGGTFKLTKKEFDTDYVVLAARTLANAVDKADIKAVNAIQDKMKIEAGSAKPYVQPNYDMGSYKATYKPLLALSKGLPDSKRTFGSKKTVDPVRFLLGSAFGWGGLPEEDAYYLNVNPGLPVGEHQITVKDVPVDSFWSISMYNREGFFQKNDLDAYSVNNLTAKPNKDGSVTIHLGGCKDKRVNCLPLTEGWNYVVRLYKPRKEILDGSWEFPTPKPVKK